VFYHTQIKDTIIIIESTRPVANNHIVEYKELKKEYVSERKMGLVILEKGKKAKLYEIICYECDDIFSVNCDFDYLLERI
jgi:hypothetical protein